ncbi:DUF2309 domain-containing protein [Croceiramulus getboli]|nr:DUF2309 domain-containing protein [Flavobacteriaceae bacterium YJPT1-3]
MHLSTLSKQLDQAAQEVAITWPLYTYVTSNPLSGFENQPFKQAVDQAAQRFQASVFPSARAFRQAWEQGAIKPEVLSPLLQAGGFTATPAYYLEQLERETQREGLHENARLDRMMIKWLSAFLDEGLAEWQMPGKEQGFFKAWSALAPYDQELNLGRASLPKTATAALEEMLKGNSAKEVDEILRYHLSALPGWTGYIKYRSEQETVWQQAFPLELKDYLAVRLFIAKHWGEQVLPVPNKTTSSNHDLQLIWLRAWEASWQQDLVEQLQNGREEHLKDSTPGKRAEAQLVFCIDTRSEAIRRHVEAQGNYETFGYAGFFGIAMDYKNPDTGLQRKSCPPIVGSAYLMSERPKPERGAAYKKHQKRVEHRHFADYFLRRMKNMLPSAFGFVEGSGFYYGLAMLARTLFPGALFRSKQKNSSSYESHCDPILHAASSAELETSLSVDEQVGIVKSAFDLTGWKEFAPLVVFAGHGSHTANNPYGSSLDCGACAASPGRHNARMLARMANSTKVREALRPYYDIPEDTVFIGAEHNTTTDAIELFDAEVPATHQQQLQALKQHLKQAQQAATQARLGTERSIATAEGKANDWADTRPEWGLARNAGFVVGPRSLTQHLDLEGRCFLHSYDWEDDTEGKALEGIMQGPMTVTQWINNHYYFSTVDNDRFGGGSKITQNITGKFGLVQGNGGDLKFGLPLQSLQQNDDELYHQPLRLSVLIQAPAQRISQILERNPAVKQLLDNAWIYLLVMDPTENNQVKRYCVDGVWKKIGTEPLPQKVDAVANETEVIEVLTV